MKVRHRYYPLACRVLAVAVINEYETVPFYNWAVYIDAVPGQNHENEYLEVAKSGSKTLKEIAGILFPCFDIERYRE